MFVVVTMTTSACLMDNGSRCIMYVYGPFNTRQEAVECARKQPDWSNPHITRLNHELKIENQK